VPIPPSSAAVSPDRDCVCGLRLGLTYFGTNVVGNKREFKVMATTSARTRHFLGSDTDDSHILDEQSQCHSGSQISVLGELPFGNVFNITRLAAETPAVNLDTFQFGHPATENLCEHQLPTKTRGYSGRPHLEFDNCRVPLTGRDNERASCHSRGTSARTLSRFSPTRNPSPLCLSSQATYTGLL